MVEFLLVDNCSKELTEIDIMEEIAVQTEWMLARIRTKLYPKLPNWVTAAVCHHFLKSFLMQVESSKCGVTGFRKNSRKAWQHLYLEN